MSKVYVGVDLGGTTIKMAFVKETGDIIKKWEILTDKDDGGKNITKHIAESIAEHLPKHGMTHKDIIGIGIGAPGFINMDTGFIYKAVNIGWKDYPLKQKLEMLTGLPVFVDNDANVAALGEMWRGAGEGAKDLLAVTLGTGVGGGVIVNGQIVHGSNGMAGEIGHITVISDEGYQCNCGRNGCLETVSSATGIVRLAKSELDEHPSSLLNKTYTKNGELTAKDVFDAYGENDGLAIKVIEKSMNYLGFVLANLANALNPEKIVIGGGVSKAGELLVMPLHKSFKQYALPMVESGSQISLAQLGNDAGVIGAAWLVKAKVENNT